MNSANSRAFSKRARFLSFTQEEERKRCENDGRRRSRSEDDAQVRSNNVGKKNSKTFSLTYRQQRLPPDLPRPPLPDLHALDLKEPRDEPVDRRGEAVVDQGDLRERCPEAAAGQRREVVNKRGDERHCVLFRRDSLSLSRLAFFEDRIQRGQGG